jgi:hypothetical protein
VAGGAFRAVARLELGEPVLDAAVRHRRGPPRPGDGLQERLAIQRQQPRVGHGGDRGLPRDVAEQRDLAHVPAGPEPRDLLPAGRDQDLAVHDRVETVSGLAFADERPAGRHVDLFRVAR